MLDNHSFFKNTTFFNYNKIFSKNDAFSLIEIILVTSLFFILITLGLGAYFNYYSISALNNDIFRVSSLIEKTQFKAMKNPDSEPYGIYIDDANLQIVSFRNAYVPGNQENIILDFEMVDYIELDLNPSPGISNEIIFESRTGKVENAGSFVIGNSQTEVSHTFTINSQGAIE